MISLRRTVLVGITAILFAPVLCLDAEVESATHTPVYTFKILKTFPHDPNAFTQGLTYWNGFLYEGTGLRGRSSIRKIRLKNGDVLQRTDLPPEFFGEGITILNNKIIQLSWQEHTGFVYDVKDFRLLNRFSYTGEGWGLTDDGHDLYMSDGTDEIRVLDGTSFSEKRRIKVHDGGERINQLNELEFVEGELFANIWQTDRIARISPKTGKVTGWIELKGLLSPMYKLESSAVLNGIAYDKKGKRLFVTGKLWPSIFEIKLIPNNR